MNAPVAALLGQRSRARIAPFRLHRPRSVEEALVLASAHAGSAYMAGGVDLVGRMKSGFAPTDIICLRNIEALRRIEEVDGELYIGACVTHQRLADDALVRARSPALPRRWSHLGSPRIRCKGTIGGNIMARESTYDATLMLMAADATLVTCGSQGYAEVSISDLDRVQGLLVGLRLASADRLKLKLDRSLSPALTIVLGYLNTGKGLERLRVAIGGAYAAPRVFPLGIEEPIPRTEVAAHAIGIASAFVECLPKPRSDWQASGEYRARMIRVLLQRLLAQADSRC